MPTSCLFTIYSMSSNCSTNLSNHFNPYPCYIQRIKYAWKFSNWAKLKTIYACIMATVINTGMSYFTEARANEDAVGPTDAMDIQGRSVSYSVLFILGVRSLANASRARQFNPLNPPGVGWVPLPQTNMAAVVGRAWSVVRGRAWSVMRGRAW